MDPLSVLTIMAGVAWINNIYDYVVFSHKHRETQDEIKHLQGEISSLNSNLGYMAIEVRENNKLIKELKTKIEEFKA